MKRGDVLIATAQGDYGKPRPAVVIQSNALNDTDSILVCLMTTTQRDTPLHRLAIEPTLENSLREPSDVMIDKILALPRRKCNPPIGHLSAAQMIALDNKLALVVGLSES